MSAKNSYTTADYLPWDTAMSLIRKLYKDGDLTKKSDLLNSYIVANYDVLHTQGKSYIVDDIIGVMKEAGLVA